MRLRFEGWGCVLPSFRPEIKTCGSSQKGSDLDMTVQVRKVL